MSSRHISPTTRRPSQTHSGLPAGPVTKRLASANSSTWRWASLAGSAGWAAAGLSPLLASLFWAEADKDANDAVAAIRKAKLRRTLKDMIGPVDFGSCCFAIGMSRYLYTEWVRFAAHAARTCGM